MMPHVAQRPLWLPHVMWLTRPVPTCATAGMCQQASWQAFVHVPCSIDALQVAMLRARHHGARRTAHDVS